MSHSIFISYCRENERQALHLLSVLRNEGFEVWIDQESIAGASIWSDEIVQNIKSSKIFIALLSEASANSANVAKEIALAAEHGKTILPIEIGNVKLPGRLEYALAGIQRTSFHDEEAIVRAVRNQVARLSGEDTRVDPLNLHRRRQRQFWTRVVLAAVAVLLLVGGYAMLTNHAPMTIANNTIAVLPFATLNTDRDSTRNLDVFSDEIISRLSSIESLKTVSASVSGAYRSSPLNPIAIAKEIGVRFIIEGSVRKQNDVNFISVRIHDAQKGGVVFETTLSGNNHVVFPLRTEILRDLDGFFRGTLNEEHGLQTVEANYKAHPNDAEAVYQLARTVVGHDKLRALDLYRRAITLDSSRLEFYLGAGLVSERLGNESQSREFGRWAVPIAERKLVGHTEDVNAQVNYAIALDIAGESDKSSVIYESLVRSHPDNPRLIFNAACCYARQAKAEQSLALLKKLFVIDPGRMPEVKYDPDFDNIRSDPRYLELVYGFRP